MGAKLHGDRRDPGSHGGPRRLSAPKVPDSDQIRLRSAIHGAEGPVNPHPPTLDRWLVAMEERKAGGQWVTPLQRQRTCCVSARCSAMATDQLSRAGLCGFTGPSTAWMRWRSLQGRTCGVSREPTQPRPAQEQTARAAFRLCRTKPNNQTKTAPRERGRWFSCTYQARVWSRAPPESGGRAEGAGVWKHGPPGAHGLQRKPWGVSANALTHHARRADPGAAPRPRRSGSPGSSARPVRPASTA